MDKLSHHNLSFARLPPFATKKKTDFSGLTRRQKVADFLLQRKIFSPVLFNKIKCMHLVSICDSGNHNRVFAHAARETFGIVACVQTRSLESFSYRSGVFYKALLTRQTLYPRPRRSWIVLDVLFFKLAQ